MNKKRIKKLQDLTITDSFLFAAVMMDVENCKGFLERVLNISIDHVEVVVEKSMIHHPEYKGVRLDVYAKDDKNTRFNVEMQVKKGPIIKRSRYYHSQMDMDILASGDDYSELPACYVIFICDFDPFGEKKYRYTLHTSCEELPNQKIDDGVHTIILSNRGENDSELPQELVNFLNYTKATLAESEKQTDDEFITQIQKSIRSIKYDRLMEDKYMLLEEMLREEREEGREEGIVFSIVTLLEDFGIVEEELIDELNSISDKAVLTRLLKISSNVHSANEFKTQMSRILNSTPD